MNRRTTVSWWMLAVWIALAPASLAEGAKLPGLNAKVLEQAYAYEDGGGYKWAGSGVPERLEHRGELILAKSPEGTYCCGFTFAVFVKTAESLGLLEGITVKQLRAAQRQWYGSSDDKSVQERQIQFALPGLKLGQVVHPKKARPGDFLQFWRGKSGHSVVFLDWVVEDGKPVGIRYRSSQKSTDGIGDTVERFQGLGGDVDPRRIYFARLTGRS